MKKLSVLLLALLLVPSIAHADDLLSRVKGFVLLQVESHGEAWYVNPVDGRRTYMPDGSAAYGIMRNLGLGISNTDLTSLLGGNISLRDRLMGRIVLQVEAHGEAYYINPKTSEVQYMKDGDAAYAIMRYDSLGITNADLAQIPVVGAASSSSGEVVSISGCQVFPADNAWNEDVSSLPVLSNSGTYVASIGLTNHLHPDFGENQTYGIPFNVVDASQPAVPITWTAYGDESDPGPYPIPPNAKKETGSDGHVLVLQTGTCMLYELYNAEKNATGWSADSGAVWDLSSDKLRPEGWTSADAAGLPILPGLVRYDEVAAGAVNHAIRFTASRTQNKYILPATHDAGSNDTSLPPMGLRVRLKANYDISNLTGQALVIATAMKKYGLILADNGSSWYFTGATDPGWNDDELNELKAIPGSAFEAVDTGPLLP